MSTDIYRQVRQSTMDALRDVSVQAERVYLRLAMGRFATRTGLVRYRVKDLAVEARVRPAELTAALEELAAAKLLLCARSAPAVYLLGVCSAFAPRSPSARTSWTAEVDAFDCADLASQARAEIEDRYPTSGQVPRECQGIPAQVPEIEKEREREKGREKEKQVRPTVLSPSAPAASLPGMDSPNQKPAKPAAKPADPGPLLELYATACPSLPTVRGKPGSGAHTAACRAWKREPDRDAWAERFRRAEASDFLTGRAGTADGRAFRADLLWLTSPGNVEKLDLGRYDNRDAKPRGPAHVESHSTRRLTDAEVAEIQAWEDERELRFAAEDAAKAAARAAMRGAA